MSTYQNPIAHSHDPETSVEAAREIDANGTRSRHADMVLALVRQYPDSTAIELGQHSDLGEYQIRRRLTDLLKAGRIVRGEPRKCSVRGTAMVTWSVAEPRPKPAVREIRTHQGSLFG